jgi:hypothetical protein
MRHLSAVIAQAQAGRWSPVLYFLATALIIVLSWVQMVWGVIALLMAVTGLWLQDQGMKAERAALGIP